LVAAQNALPLVSSMSVFNEIGKAEATRLKEVIAAMRNQAADIQEAIQTIKVTPAVKNFAIKTNDDLLKYANTLESIVKDAGI